MCFTLFPDVSRVATASARPVAPEAAVLGLLGEYAFVDALAVPTARRVVVAPVTVSIFFILAVFELFL